MQPFMLNQYKDWYRIVVTEDSGTAVSIASHHTIPARHIDSAIEFTPVDFESIIGIVAE